MTQEQVLRTLRSHRAELRALRVANLELFGSSARGAAREDSDVDLLVDFDGPVGLFAFYRVEAYLEKLLDTDKVNLVLRRAVLEELRERIYGQAIPCFAETGGAVSLTQAEAEPGGAEATRTQAS